MPSELRTLARAGSAYLWSLVVWQGLSLVLLGAFL